MSTQKALFEFDHVAFSMPEKDFFLAQMFVKQVLGAEISRGETFDDWGFVFQSFGEVETSMQQTWTRDELGRPHIGIKVRSMSAAFAKILSWIEQYEQEEPEKIWSNEDNSKQIYRFAFLPYDIEFIAT